MPPNFLISESNLQPFNVNYSNTSSRCPLEQMLKDRGEDLMIKMPTSKEICKELQYNAQYLSANKLCFSSKFIGELLLSITTEEDAIKNIWIKKYINDNLDTAYTFEKIFYEDASDPCFNKLIVARNLYDLREFKKCTDLLKPYAMDTNQQAAMFLYHYSLFMHGDMRKEEEYFETSKSSDIDNHRQKDRNALTNNAAYNIERILEPFYNQGLLNDLNCYLLGIAKRELEKFTEAVDIFATS